MDHFLWAMWIAFILPNTVILGTSRTDKKRKRIRELFEEEVRSKSEKLRLKQFIGTSFQIIIG
jgi:hypothetical protein